MNNYFRTLLLLLLFFIFSANLSLAQTGVVKGRVYNHKNNEPIPFTNIIIDGNPTQGATTDIDGNYIIKNVKPGYIRLVATSVGFKKFISEDFLVTNAHPVFINISMDELIISLDAVEIRPDVITRKEESPVSMQSLTIQEIERSPVAVAD